MNQHQSTLPTPYTLCAVDVSVFAIQRCGGKVEDITAYLDNQLSCLQPWEGTTHRGDVHSRPSGARGGRAHLPPTEGRADGAEDLSLVDDICWFTNMGVCMTHFMLEVIEEFIYFAGGGLFLIY